MRLHADRTERVVIDTRGHLDGVARTRRPAHHARPGRRRARARDLHRPVRTRRAIQGARARPGRGDTGALAQEPFIGEIRCFGYNFVPRGWAPLNGQLLSIAQNTALFSLLGTQFGGDGRTTFGLPDMRGRSLIHIGQGPGLGLNSTPGEQGGSETVTLTTAQLPAHNHVVTPQGSAADATLMSPANGVPATKARTTLYAPGPGTVAMSPTLTSTTGGSAPVATRSPYLSVICGIALEGIYPSRD